MSKNTKNALKWQNLGVSDNPENSDGVGKNAPKI